MPGPRLFSRLVLFVPLTAFFMPAQVPESAKRENQAVKPNSVHFEDIARQAGINMLNVSGGAAHKEFIIETTGNGAVIIDYDNDGWPDIYLSNGSTVEGFSK